MMSCLALLAFVDLLVLSRCSIFLFVSFVLFCVVSVITVPLVLSCLWGCFGAW